MKLGQNNVQWAELLTQNKTNLPPLFYAFHWSLDGIHFQVTDLVALWSCRYDDDSLVSEARSQASSIDPSTVSQFKTLCQKLQESLSDDQNTFAAAGNGEPEASIHLQTHVDLPKPLRPLTWTFKLERQSPSVFSDVITKPCLMEMAVADRGANYLLQTIKDKDHVIQKLLDNIEGSVIDLSGIFPGIAGLRSRKTHVNVAEASRHVPGMAAFNQDAWSAQQESRRSMAEVEMASLSQSFDRLPAAIQKEAYVPGWFKLLETKRTKQGAVSKLRDRPAQVSTTQIGLYQSSQDSESDFETQQTPPSAKKKDKNTMTNTAESSGSDTDRDASPGRRRKISKSLRIGSVGRNKGKQPLSGDETASTSPGSAQDILNDAKMGQLSQIRSESSEIDENSNGSKVALKGKSRLGMIGKNKAVRKPSSSPPAQKPSSNACTPSRKLGLVGLRKDLPRTPAKSRDSTLISPSNRKSKDTPEHDSDATASTISSPTVANDEQAPSLEHTLAERELGLEPETGEQAAARRREELKRRINVGGPTKKKRKF